MSTGALSLFWEPDYLTSDGWEDELDRFYDRTANCELFNGVWVHYLRLNGKLPPLAYEYYLSVHKTRGYDPTPETYGDHMRGLIDCDESDDNGDQVYLGQAKEGAHHALLHYNERTSKTLEFVKIIKAFYQETFIVGGHLFFVTFEAQEKGNPDTRKHYQTRVLTGPCLDIIKLCSFRPKP